MPHSDFAHCTLVGANSRQESIPVKGKKGRTVELLTWTGQAIFRNGEIWTSSAVEVDEFNRGSGTVRGHQIFVHADGSTITGTYEGKGKAEAGSNRYTARGTWRYAGGTGRASGIKGGGTFKAHGAGDKFVSYVTGTATKA